METRQTGVQHRAASREHQRLARAKLAGLRAELREALSAKKRRMAEIVASIRTQRTTLRNAMKQRRLEVRHELRRSAESARAVAREGFRQKKADARLEATSAIALARFELLAERQHQAEQRRITREERAARAAGAKRVESPRAHADVRAQAIAPFRSLFQKVKGSLRPIAGESHEEAFLTYAEAHPEVVHAHVEPEAERAIVKTKAELATTERQLLGAAVTDTKPEATRKAVPKKTVSRDALARAVTFQSGPLAEMADVLRLNIEDAHAELKSAQAKQARLREQFSTGDYGGLSRDAFFKEYQKAEFDVPAREKGLRAAEGRFFKLTGRRYSAVDQKASSAPALPSPAAPSVVATPNAYEMKRAARLERMRSKADRLRGESNAAYARVRSIGDRIPMGQPILVGHHSQRRHERDIERMDKGMSKSVALAKKADALAQRAARAERSQAVSSDDPEALRKLREKVGALNASRERMKAANAAIRGKKDVAKALKALGFTDAQAAKIQQPDFAGRIGFPDYELTNASSEARRLEQRIKQLEANATAAPREETAGDVRIVEADNRVRLVFPGKPSEPTRKALKSAGFRWSPTVGAWQRHASHGAWYEARKIAAAANAAVP